MRSAVLMAVAATSALTIVSVAEAQPAQGPTMTPVTPGVQVTTPMVPGTTTTTTTVTPEPVTTTTVTGQETGVSTAGRRVLAPKNALELAVSGAYNQGIGKFSSLPGDTIGNTAGAGIALNVEAGFRVNPQLMLGIWLQGTEYNANNQLPDGTNVRDATFGIQANWHFMPYASWDPWLGLGSGWHGYWVVPDVGRNLNRQGLNLIRLRLGVDYRVIPEIAIGPVIGGDMSLFLSERGPVNPSFSSINGERLNFAVFGGLLARFDLLGQAVGEPATVASR